MKKAIIVVLFVSLAFQSVPYMRAQESENRVTRLQRLKQTLSRELREYTKCIKRDESCDSKRKKILYTAGAVVAALAVTALGLTAKHLKRSGEGVAMDDLVLEEQPTLEEKREEESERERAKEIAFELKLEAPLTEEEESEDESDVVVEKERPSLFRREPGEHGQLEKLGLIPKMRRAE